MKNIITTITALLVLITMPNIVFAQNTDWQIEQFHSEITINQDTSIHIEETIEVDFGALQRRGIFRTIPYLYSHNGKSIRTEIHNIEVTDENGVPYDVSQERNTQSLQLRIGNPDIYLSGENIYVIKYKLEDVIQVYDSKPELYWNVTGSEWEVPILQASAVVRSENAEIIRIECFSGEVGSAETCNKSSNTNLAEFNVTNPITFGEDFTIVVGLSDTNTLVFPGLVERTTDLIIENIAYPLAVIPFLFIYIMWWKKGRDRSYISEVYYYKPSDKSERPAPVFPRMTLPLTYSPINGLSPSEVGTLIDERVHIEDIIAEIVELARLGYLKISKSGKKGLFKQQDFEFNKLKESDEKLEPHQKEIFQAIFSGNSKTKKISELKNKFYTSLPKIRSSLYKQLITKDLYNQNPDNTKTIWLVVFIVINSIMGTIIFALSMVYFNFFPLILLLILIPVGLIFVFSMPRRTAWGYSLFQQTKALREYIKVGKWRHDIAEKHLFLDEMLPLAISLGVVKELAKEMDELGITAPSYVSGMQTGSLANSFAVFNSSLARNMTASPSGSSASGFSTSGRSSWSGGSGFSGGSSGGGFGGGGGGGSW